MLRQEREVIFDFIHNIGEVFSDTKNIDTDQLLNRILFFTIKTGKAAAGAIYLFNADRTRLFARAVSGIFPPLYDADQVRIDKLLAKSQHLETLVKTRPIAPKEGLIGSAAAIGNGIIIEDAEIDARVPTYSEASLSIRSLLIAPMRFGNEVLGVLVLTNRIDGQPFTPCDLNLLQAMADQASVPVHYAGLRAALDQKRQLDRDMQSARQIQASLLPQHLPQLAGITLAAYNLPAMNIGGDYYDFISIDSEHLGIIIADVSGKGIGGAMMMAVCQNLLRDRAAQERSPAQMLSKLNQNLSTNLAEDMFITMLYIVLNTRTRELKFARAGHEQLLICRDCTNHQKPILIHGPGIAIGLANPTVFDHAIRDVTLHLESDSSIILYTDGITEAHNEKNEEWGIENLLRTIQTHAHCNPEKMIDVIRKEITQFVGTQTQYDDMTLLALKFL